MNPFITSRPLDPEEFLGRGRLLRELAERIVKGDSTLITGGPQVGKTSVLKKLSDPKVFGGISGGYPSHVRVHLLDVQGYNRCEPPDFWRDALEHLRGEDADLDRELSRAEEGGFGSRYLNRILKRMVQLRLNLVLLVDEFPVLIDSPKMDASFWGILRKKMGGRYGCTLVMTSHRDSSQLMSKLESRLGSSGSPFNLQEDRHLGLLEEGDIDTLLDRGGERIMGARRRYLRRLAGRHPKLLQTGAALMYDTPGRFRPVDFAHKFESRIGPHLQLCQRSWRPDVCLLATIVAGSQLVPDRFKAVLDRVREADPGPVRDLVATAVDWGLDVTECPDDSDPLGWKVGLGSLALGRGFLNPSWMFISGLELEIKPNRRTIRTALLSALDSDSSRIHIVARDLGIEMARIHSALERPELLAEDLLREVKTAQKESELLDYLAQLDVCSTAQEQIRHGLLPVKGPPLPPVGRLTTRLSEALEGLLDPGPPDLRPLAKSVWSDCQEGSE